MQRRTDSLWAFLGFGALAIFWTWPVAATLSSRIPHDAGDPVLNTWILWWNAQATPLTETWWNAPMMWPMAGSMALSEHLLGMSVVATPLQWLGVTPIGAYNVWFLLTFALSGFFAYLLGRELTGSRSAGVCAGIAFAFAPYRAPQLAHIQVLTSQWMPLALLGLHAYRRTGATRWLVVFGAAWLLQALSNGYYMLFFPVLVGLWLAWFVDWRRAPRVGVAIVAAWTIASLPLVPILSSTARSTSAGGSSGQSLRSAISARYRRRSPTPHRCCASGLKARPATTKLYLFTGVAVVILAVAGLALVLARTARPLGARRSGAPPLLHWRGHRDRHARARAWRTGDGPAPYRPFGWLLWLPGFNGLRVPARFAMVSTLCLAVASSLAVAWWSKTVAPGRPWRALAGVAIVAGLLADGMTRRCRWRRCR